MDRDEAIRLLRGGAEGVAKWNKLTASQRDCDLSGVDLRSASLVGIDFSAAHLTKAKLDKADLRNAELHRSHCDQASFAGARLSRARICDASFVEANLSRADLHGVDLYGSVLTRARLTATNPVDSNLRSTDFDHATLDGANLSGANLSGASIRNASLRKTILWGANLSGLDAANADISNAVLGMTVIGCDLTVARGLETVIHQHPSTIRIANVRTSARPWPLSFFRGCGLSDIEIETLTSLSNSPIQYYSAFISYSTKDDAFATKLHDALQAKGIRCWLDKHAVLPGDNIYRAVNEGIRLWDKVLLCCSKDSLSSWWVKREVEHAFEKERRLSTERKTDVLATIPLDLDGYLLSDACKFEHADQLRARHAPPFEGWQSDEKLFDAQVGRVVKALRADEQARPKPPTPKL